MRKRSPLGLARLGLENQRGSQEPQRDLSAGAVSFHGILTADARMKEVLALVGRMARSDTTVLIRGESGSGKELVARALHDESYRSGGPFIAFNCAALSDTLLESQLFGHVRGAFTGAVRDHEGLFEQAHGGTLFLDEVAEIPLDLQAKLLRVLEERSFTRVGGSRPISVDVRIVSATHRSLRALVAHGRFREDLMYRLRVVPVFLPPLRERRGDVALLSDHFLARLNARAERHVRRIAPDVMRVLLDHRWPGNVRELANVLEYAYAVGDGDEVRFQDLPPELRDPSWPSAEPRALRSHDDEERALRRALSEANGKVGRAAESLGMSRATFWRKRKQYGV